MALLTGVAGGEGLAQELGRVVAKRTLNGRPVSVQQVRNDEPLSGFHILFVDNHVRFEVSLDAARCGGLKIGAPLLSVAMRVQE